MDRRILTKGLLIAPGFAFAQKPGASHGQTSAMTPLDLSSMRTQYRKDLFEDYLPFHERFVNDKEFGGFRCSVRPTGELISDAKTVWFEGRGTWVYSFLYNHVAREQKYLDIAARSVRLLEHSRPTGDEFRPKALKRIN